VILVTGATGYVGGHLLARLAAGGGPVRGLVRRPDAKLPTGVESVNGDITEPDSLPAAVEGVETVIHCAAITGDRKEPYRGAYDRVNREGTANLVAAARAESRAFLPLYDRYFDRVLGYARLRLRDRAICEDVTSQVFTAALAQIGRFRGQGSFAGWLFQIARNAVHDVQRQRAGERERLHPGALLLV